VIAGCDLARRTDLWARTRNQSSQVA